jgi:putative membrane protein
MRYLSLFTLAAAGLLAAGLFADETRKGRPDDEKFTDKMFVEKAAIGGMFEVKSSQVAQRMATDSNVKSFAAKMVMDHTKANQELTALARQKGWRLPTALDQKHLDMLNDLSKKQGSDFDKAYTEIQVKAHDKTVALFETAAENAQDADLKAWVKKTLPTLQEHQRMAKSMESHGTREGSTTTTPPAGGRTRPVPPR